MSKKTKTETEKSKFVFNMCAEVRCRCGEDKLRVLSDVKDSKLHSIQFTCVNCGNVFGGLV